MAKKPTQSESTQTPESASGTSFDGKAFCKQLTTAPGVYQMYDKNDQLLYVGKAASLKARVSSYFQSSNLTLRTLTMVSQISRVEITITRTANEALLLEGQLIKSLKPKYNVLLRDDKSYPYIIITEQDYPRVMSYRGARSQKARYFGPYTSGTAVRETLEVMAKVFRLRTCEESVFRNRSRPCLQYQINRCTAPCVGLISDNAYQESVRRAAMFLEGRHAEVVTELTSAMEAASADMAFEAAAQARDQISMIRHIQSTQKVYGPGQDQDFLACAASDGDFCVALISYRNGMSIGLKTFFPASVAGATVAEVMDAFVAQHYAVHEPPQEIISSIALESQQFFELAFQERRGSKVRIFTNVRSERAKLLDTAIRNATAALAARIAENQNLATKYAALKQLLNRSTDIKRIECFDISHTMGEATVASCVVFDENGPANGQYRRYNIRDITGGDDYAAMTQALQRRFSKAKESGVLPDLLLIDGGLGQLRSAEQVLREFSLLDQLLLLGVAKGKERKAGDERLIFIDGSELRPGADSQALQLIQQVRDEAHRFAITGHRGRRQKKRQTSSLEEIEGVGSKRRAALLKYFGGLATLRAAGVEEISRVEGVSKALATRIYASLHGLDS